MVVKPDVDTTNVHPLVWMWIDRISVHHRIRTRTGATVTCLRRPPADRDSLHSPPDGELVQAADFSRQALDAHHAAWGFCRELQTLFGLWIGVVLEPEWLTDAEVTERGGIDKIVPHIHIQLKRVDWPGVL